MRMLRLSLFWTVIVVLLGGLAGVVGAQDEPATPVYVTGFETCEISNDSLCLTRDGVKRCRDQSATCSARTSDPRVSGTWWNKLNSDCPEGGGCLYWGKHVLSSYNPTRGWDCTFSGLADPYPDSGNDALAYGVCPGTGAYEGLTYTWYHVAKFGPAGQSASFGDHTDYHGLIYADELPSLTPPVVTGE